MPDRFAHGFEDAHIGLVRLLLPERVVVIAQNKLRRLGFYSRSFFFSRFLRAGVPCGLRARRVSEISLE